MKWHQVDKFCGHLNIFAPAGLVGFSHARIHALAKRALFFMEGHFGGIT